MEIQPSEERKLVHIYSTDGTIKAELIRAFLETNGIRALVSQESAGIAYGFTVGRLGEARIFVYEEQVAQAEELLAALERGEFELRDEDYQPIAFEEDLDEACDDDEEDEDRPAPEE